VISVIVPAHNAARTLETCLRALTQQTIPRGEYEIIVANDGSTDATALIAEAAGARVAISGRIGQPAGPAAARNAGVREACGDVVLFTDADCEPLPDWIERMVAPLADPVVVGVKGAYRSRQRELIARLTQAEFEDKYARMRQRATVDFIDTYSAGYRRDALLQAGGFDETFPLASVEDVELSFRLAEQGARLLFVPEARVWHIHATSLWFYLRKKARYGFWRALVYRWHPGKIRGDSHTDPILKFQFALVALGGLCVLAALVDGWLLAVTWLAGLALVATTLPFVVRSWPRDRMAALIAPPVHSLRAIVQAGALAVGLVVHSLPGHSPTRSRGK
jgi:cellulose synthase/poly-beta-1,6-N-acetylglucosamine synthase-like glycosyltransferase